MDLNTLWFILIAVLFCGYFVLEGFDFGVGMLLPFLGKNDTQRRIIINTIGPHWDGNEVWLITAGGAMFAAFPSWYATLFSGFYLALFLMLIALIVRGIAIEFRSKDESPRWRKFWDWAICIGSLIPAILWGVAFANIVRGVPIDAEMHFTGNFFDLINGPAFLGGLVSLSVFLVHGAVYLSIKTEDPVKSYAQAVAKKIWLPAALAVLFLAVEMASAGWLPFLASVVAFVALLAGRWLIHREKYGVAFGLNAAAILLTTAAVFLALFPNVLVSSLDPNFNLTIYNSASGTNTLRVMSIVALIFVPIVLLYQAWSYRIFRKRIGGRPEELHY